LKSNIVLKKESPFRRFWPLVFVAALLCGCSTVKFVADYDSATLDKTLDAAKEVDLFYGKLLEAPETSRAYAKYADPYVTIEVDLRALVSRNKSRTLNDESTTISSNIVKLWDACWAAHKANNAYKSGMAKLDRDNFSEQFQSAEQDEIAKQSK